MRITAITIMTLLTASAAILPAQETFFCEETWTDPGVAGWSGATARVTLTNPGGCLNVGFRTQGYPYPEYCVAQKGLEPDVWLTNISFRLRAVDVQASNIRVCMHTLNGDRSWNLTLPGGAPGEWTTNSIPVEYSAGWSFGPRSSETLFYRDLAHVDSVGVYVRRGGRPSVQNFQIDDFTLSGFRIPPSVPISGIVYCASELTGQVHVAAQSLDGATGVTAVVAGPGPYEIAGVPSLADYNVSAYCDMNSNGVRNAWEPSGEWGANPVRVWIVPVTGVDIVLREPDADNDGLPDWREREYGTDPYNPDTDGDGYGDGIEVRARTDPLDPLSYPRASVAIRSPTAEPFWATTNRALALAGTASDDLAVERVTFSNNRSESGACAGTTNWNCGGITLYNGTNIVTVTAYGEAGNTASDTLTVLFTETYPQLDEAILRAGMALEEVNMPDYLLPGEVITVQWKILAYVPLISAMRVRLPDGYPTTNVTVNGTRTGIEEGRWHVADRDSKVYSFECQWAVPNTPGAVRVRFVAAQQDGYAYMNANAPGGVDPRPYGTDGKEIIRDILEDRWYSPIVSEALVVNPPWFDSLAQAILRAGGTAERIAIPDNLAPGTKAVCAWDVLSYVPIRSRIRVKLPTAGDYMAEAACTAVADGRWYISTNRSKVYSFRYEWTVPNDPGTGRVRFVNAQRDGYAWMNANIPGGVDPRPYGTDGKEVLRSITAPPSAPVSLEVNGAAAWGEIDYPGDADWYVFDAAAAGNYSVETFLTGTLAGSAVRLCGPDSRTDLIAEGQVGVAAWLEAGTYYARVTGLSAGTGTYRIGVTAGQ